MFDFLENDISSGLNASDLAPKNGAIALSSNPLSAAINASPGRHSQIPVTPSIVNASADLSTDSADSFIDSRLGGSLSISTERIATSTSSAKSQPGEVAEDALLFGGLSNRSADQVSIDQVSTGPARKRGQNARNRGLSQQALDQSAGTFTTSGKVSVDFLFDGGRQAGELAVFSLEGMGGLSRRDFIEEATSRALSDGSQGQIVIRDKTEAAQFNGSLVNGAANSRNFNKGKIAKTTTVEFSEGGKSSSKTTRFAVMLVPSGTVAGVRAGNKSPLFSIADLNPRGITQIAKAGNNVFAMEASRVDKSRADFNDIVFRMKGATDNVKPLQQLVDGSKDWRGTPTAQLFLNGSDPSPSPSPVGPSKPNNPSPDPVGPSKPNNSSSDLVGLSKPNNPNPSPISSKIVRDISTDVSKFNGNSSEAQIIASGANKITIGTQTIYIGTEQVSSINQNPIMRSFDPKNSQNNWTRRDIETSGTDGRGNGLLWTGKALYGVFSVDGTQNDGADFRKAASGAQQNWLKSYGTGGGARIGVLTQLDPLTGKLLKAAHLSAITSSGKTNSLNISDVTVNQAGNLVVKAQSFFSPRQPDGSAKKQNPGSNAGSPFSYTLEITADLQKVLKTSSPGWS